MKPQIVEKTVHRLAQLIEQNQFEELETDTLDIKAVPPDGQMWRERHKTACAFLNTRGGIMLLGIKEEGAGRDRRDVFTGWKPHAEPNVKKISRQFTDADGRPLEIDEAFPPPLILDFLTGKLAVVLVDELAADVKYAFYRNEAYRRVLTGDHKIPQDEIARQREFKEKAVHARELQLVSGVKLADLDVDKLNDYITQLNRPVKIETVKPDLTAGTALPGTKELH